MSIDLRKNPNYICVFFNITKTKNNASQTESLDLRRFVVRVAGVEPVRNCFHKNLNLTRLPVPPYPHGISPELIVDSKNHRRAFLCATVVLYSTYALSILLLFKQRAQTYWLVTTPSFTTLTFCTLALYKRGVLRLLWLTLLPDNFAFPQTLQTLDILHLQNTLLKHRYYITISL